jgi:bifunctional non-homologous end joining protein LigD
MAGKKTTPRTQLDKDHAKRDFDKTAGPSKERRQRAGGNRYLIQKRRATRLYFDFRLELNGVLKSWAVTAGPRLNPRDRRLAVHVEDHPLDYGSSGEAIPEGQYVGDEIMLWDRGTWDSLGDAKRDYARGNLTFNLNGKRLKGRWHLVRLRNSGRGDRRDNWLLIKGKEPCSRTSGEEAVRIFQKSVVSRRGMETKANELDLRARRARKG